MTTSQPSTGFYFPTSSTATSATTSPPRPATNGSYFPPMPLSELDEDEYDDLPYPVPLPRQPFLEPDFSPATYLATLRNRHQTLEDLRTELRDRVSNLSTELVDLVNAEYEGLMSVGLGLRGGQGEVEGVRVGVKGFEREVAAVRDAVAKRKVEIGGLIGERRKAREGVVLARRLLEIDDRLGEIEGRLGLREGEEDDGTGVEETARLFAQLKACIASVGQHSFVDAQKGRLEAARRALAADLGAALRQARTDGDTDRILELVAAYREVGEAAEAVKVLKVRS